jgi:hypothetical protein
MEWNIKELRKALLDHYQDQDWSALNSALKELNSAGQALGKKEVALRAQALSELLGYRAGGRIEPGPKLGVLFDDLLTEVSHLQWVTETSSLDEPQSMN